MCFGPSIGFFARSYAYNHVVALLQFGVLVSADLVMALAGEPAGVKWLHLNENLLDSSGAEYTLPYPVVLESFAGTWFDASQIYREWALAEAAWTRAGPLSARAKLTGANGVAQWLLDTPMWAQGGGSGPSAAGFAPQLAEHLELKDIGYFWCFWMVGKAGQDQAYPSPNYTPVNESLFNSSAAAMHNARVHACAQPPPTVPWGLLRFYAAVSLCFQRACLSR